MRVCGLCNIKHEGEWMANGEPMCDTCYNELSFARFIAWKTPYIYREEESS